MATNPNDQVARDLVAKLDELENVDRQLRGFDGLQHQKASIEGEIEQLRTQLAGGTPKPSKKPAADEK